jgi:outer membrane protein assembly factor BamB
MRLQAALFFAACLSPAAAIYSDEVNHVDFHHALLGTPSPDSTFFLKPSSASNASLLYTLSDKLLVGAVNPRDGALVWRQNLSRSADSPARGAGLLRGLDGNDALVGAVGNYISSWSAQDGKLGWEKRFSEGVVADLELLELEDATATSGVRDTIAVVGSESAGLVTRLDGSTGKTVWEHKDARLVLRFNVLLPPS